MDPSITAGSRRRAALIPVTLCAGLLLLGVACGRAKPAPHIVIVLPDGYSGQFWIIQGFDDTHPQAGDSPIVVHVSDFGIGRIENDDVLFDWHTTSARWASGSEIPIHGPPGAASVHSLTTINNEIHCYLVGTQEAVRAFYEKEDRGLDAFTHALSAESKAP